MADSSVAKLELLNETIELPVVVGSENEHAVDISKLRGSTGYITLDDGYGNTGSCSSGVTFINGEQGMLRYRGYPIEQLAEKSGFIESAYLLIHGELPTADQLSSFQSRIDENTVLSGNLLNVYKGFNQDAHPMAMLSSMLNAAGCYHPDIMDPDADLLTVAAKLIGKTSSIAAANYRHMKGEAAVAPLAGTDYAENLLHMMFGSGDESEVDPDHVDIMNKILILHADHEQNCSTSTVRMVASSGANMFTSCSAGVSALWGWRHGGANVAVLSMLEELDRNKVDYKDFMEKVKNKEAKLMGFGHRVYKSFDPRANILKRSADTILAKLNVSDPLLDMARRLEEVALEDSYFKDRNLYPNVDFYSGIIMRAMGIPVEMFTVMFAVGRMPGWVAHFKEMVENPAIRISRPRQVYTGYTSRDYAGIETR